MLTKTQCFLVVINFKNKFTYVFNAFYTDKNIKLSADYTVITFTLNDKSVSTVLSYTKAKGIVRESAGHTRSYYIDSEGNLCKIQIDAAQKIASNGETNDYTTSITVDIKR